MLVIHRILLDMLDAEKQSFSARVLLLGIAKFCIVSGGSLLIGLLFGVLSSLLTLATRHVEGGVHCSNNVVVDWQKTLTYNPLADSEPILLLVLAYSAYVSAEIFEWSGVVSIICCGLVCVTVSCQKMETFIDFHYMCVVPWVVVVVGFCFSGAS